MATNIQFLVTLIKAWLCDRDLSTNIIIHYQRSEIRTIIIIIIFTIILIFLVMMKITSDISHHPHHPDHQLDHHHPDQIRDGDQGYSTEIGKFCGSDFPPIITSSGRSLWLRLVSHFFTPVECFQGPPTPQCPRKGVSEQTFVDKFVKQTK